MREGWEVKRLDDLCFIELGRTPYRGNKTFWDTEKQTENVWLSIADLLKTEGDVVLDSKEYISDIAADGSKIVKKGTLLVSFKLTLGRLAFAGKDLFTNEAIAALTIKDEKLINKYFLYQYLSFFDWNAATAGDVKVKGKTLNKAKLKEIDVIFPKSLPEQQRIVAILDDAFAAIAKAKENAEQNLRNAKELFESYLKGIFENKGEGWEEKKLGEIAFVKSGGTPSRSKKEYWIGKIAWYSSGELNDLFTKDPERHINDLAINNSNAKLFPKGSLLIGMYDTAALKMSIIDRDATFNQAIAGVKPNEKIDLTFILHSINSIKPDLLNLRRGVRQKNLSLGKIKDIPIFLPPLETQQGIVEKLDKLSVETQRLEAIYKKKIEDLEELKKAILQKAFTGELKTENTMAV
jgi:type I restriction enzyme, S subunit